MAKINGIEIKNVKHFADHEGAPIAQGDVWYNGKKLGFWSQDSWGGPDQYHFDESVLNDAVKSYVASDYVPAKYKVIADLDCLLGDLINIKETEKRAKKGFKDGYKTYVEATDGYHIRGYYTKLPKKFVPNSDYHKKFIGTCEKDFFKNEKVEVAMYEGLGDFEITTK